MMKFVETTLNFIYVQVSVSFKICIDLDVETQSFHYILYDTRLLDMVQEIQLVNLGYQERTISDNVGTCQDPYLTTVAFPSPTNEDCSVS